MSLGNSVRPITRLLAAMAIGVAAGALQANPVIYSQPEKAANDGTAWASQNDTGVGGFGLFATTYDDFVYGDWAAITDVHWTGVENSAPTEPHSSPTAFTIQFYSNAGGLPGGSVFSQTVAGNGNETNPHACVGFTCYDYSVDINPFVGVAGTTYWMSIVADVDFPPQWYWREGTGGNDNAYNVTDGFGATETRSDMAFELTGRANGGGTTPEPATLALLGLGLAGLALSRRRKQG